NVSMMPDGLETGLTLQDFADLVDYLASLKAPESVTVNEQGMPAVIPMLEHSVELRPFHTQESLFHHPVWFGPVPGLADVYAVVEHETGKVWLLEKNPGGREAKTLFLETGRVMTGTRGLLGMVFH